MEWGVCQNRFLGLLSARAEGIQSAMYNLQNAGPDCDYICNCGYGWWFWAGVEMGGELNGVEWARAMHKLLF